MSTSEDSTSLPPVLPIRPFTKPAHSAVHLPGSKSITNRALLLSALGEGSVVLSGALFSEDTAIMAEALRRLGFQVRENESAHAIEIRGEHGKIPAKSADIFVGNAGTAARFLTALCAAAPDGVFKIDGIPQMRRRPMKGLIDALRSLGADIRCPGEEGFFPIEIRAQGLKGGPVSVDASESSQMLSALLMAAPLAAAEVVIKLKTRVREPFVQMTMQLMHQFGVKAVQEPDALDVISVPRQRYLWFGPAIQDASRIYPVEPDASAASYFAALPLVVGGAILLRKFPKISLQGDAEFVAVLKRAGLEPSIENEGLMARFGENSARRGIEQNFHRFSDTFLTLAAISPLLVGQTRIIGIAHTRKQETDRVAGMTRELRKLGQEVVETEDSLEIHPRPLPRADHPIEIDTYGDHRFAMSFAILGCHDLRGDGKPWLAIRDPACCAKTFPEFFDLLEGVRRESSG